MRSNLARSPIEPSLERSLKPAGAGPRLAVVSPLGEVEDPLDERWMGKTLRRHVAEFGHVFALLGALVGAWLAWRGYSLWGAVGITLAMLGFRALCLTKPAMMRPLWWAWMRGAMALGAVVTAVLLSIMWTAVLMPIAYILRMVGKRVMDLSYRDGRASYWENREARKDDFVLLERQF